MKKYKIIIIVCSVLILLFGAFVTYQVITTNLAHNTFDGYCKWRGLTVVSQTSDYGYCKNETNGMQYKMVLYQGKWYLDGDLPCGFLCL